MPNAPLELPAGTLTPKLILRFLDQLWATQDILLRHRIGDRPIEDLVNLGYYTEPLKITAADARSINELRAAKMWNQAGASVCVMNPELMTELLDATDNFLSLPTQIYDRLPYPNPLLIFPEPIPTPLANGEQGHAFAAYIGGLSITAEDPENAAGLPVLVRDPSRNALNMVLLCTVEGRPGVTDISTVSIASPRFNTIGEGVAVVTKHYGTTTYTVPGTVPAESRALHVGRAMMIAAMCLTYISAANNDVETLPSPPKGRKVPGNPTGKANPPRWMQAGYVFGPQVGAARRLSTQPPAPGTGGTKRPHIRRLHHHLYWTGPGRTIPLVHLLWPIPVRGGNSGVPTLHKVEPRSTAP